MSKKAKADAVAERLETSVSRVPAIPPEDFLSTGSTILNLAISGKHDRGVPKGTYLYIVGDSGSSKTWFSFNLFAEAAKNKNFDKYRFVFDNAENGALMDVEKYFGAAVRNRLEPPYKEKDDPVYSETVQEFYQHIALNCREGPCIYVLDSMDALNDDADEDKFDAELKKYETGKGDVPGSMGMAKAKTNSKNINRVARELRKNGSILVVISQTRDKVGGVYPGQKTRGGGRALRFYAHIEIWTSIKNVIEKTVMGKKREIGVNLKVDIQKNRINGWEGKVELKFLKKYGIDDLGNCCDFLIDEGHWSDGKSGVVAPEFEFEGSQEKLIQKIQEDGDEWELAQLTAKVWKEIEDASAPKRKPRYA